MGISVPSGYGQIVMSPWLIEFKRQFPGIVLDVLFENRADNLRDEVDIAIRVMQEPPLSAGGAQLGGWCATSPAPPKITQTNTACRKRYMELRASPLITAGVMGRQLRAGRLPRDGAPGSDPGAHP